MDKNQVFTVKIYFINPIDLLSVIVNTLIELEYEACAISDLDKENLLKILPENNRNVIFICIRNKLEIDNWLKYAEQLYQMKDTHIIIGAFVYDNIDQESKNRLLEQNISTIEFGTLKSNALGVMRNILTFFEAKGKRSYIRTKTYGIAEAYFYVKSREEPITAKITDISAYACSCEIDLTNKFFFEVDIYFSEILFVLGGIRVRTAAKVLGFSKLTPNIYILKFCTAKIDGGKIIYEESITPEISRKLHDYIRKCLKDELSEKFARLNEEKNPQLKVEAKHKEQKIENKKMNLKQKEDKVEQKFSDDKNTEDGKNETKIVENKQN